jgi:hypothetical protein
MARADPQFTQYLDDGVGVEAAASGGLSGPAAGGITGYCEYGGVGP